MSSSCRPLLYIRARARVRVCGGRARVKEKKTAAAAAAEPFSSHHHSTTSVKFAVSRYRLSLSPLLTHVYIRAHTCAQSSRGQCHLRPPIKLSFVGPRAPARRRLIETSLHPRVSSSLTLSRIRANTTTLRVYNLIPRDETHTKTSFSQHHSRVYSKLYRRRYEAACAGAARARPGAL